MNLILSQAHERIFSLDEPVSVVQLGLYVLRGDNMYGSCAVLLNVPLERWWGCWTRRLTAGSSMRRSGHRRSSPCSTRRALMYINGRLLDELGVLDVLRVLDVLDVLKVLDVLDVLDATCVARPTG